MRLTLPRLALFASLLLTLGTPASANDSVPTNGTPIPLIVGQWGTITIVGFAGCKFEVDATSSDTKVATLDFKEEKKAKKQKVRIRAESAGTTMVTVQTKNSSNPGCQGFEFSFPVTVTPNTKQLLKDGKAQLKQDTKEFKAGVKEVLKFTCDEIDSAVALAKAGKLTPDDALEAIETQIASLSEAIALIINLTVDRSFTDLGALPSAQGFEQTNAALIELTPGGCGAYDEMVEDLLDEGRKTEKKLNKKYKKALKQLEKIAAQQDAELLSLLSMFFSTPATTTPTAVPSAVPQTQPTAPAKPLERTFTSSGRFSSSVLTRLKIGGIADAEAGQVTVKIVGPDGFEDEQMVDVADDCSWNVDFMSLKPGNYVVTLTQGDNSSSFKTLAI